MIATLVKKKRKLLAKALAEGKIKPAIKDRYEVPPELVAEGITEKDIYKFIRKEKRKV